MLEKTIQYATQKHQDVNHHYDTKPYDFHLNMVYETAQQFRHLVAETELENVYCACWVHDIIEDARETYNDVAQQTNKTIAELAYALTNEKGKSRSERANDNYYLEMHAVPNAVFVKLCDRIANVTHSKNQSDKKLATYQKENDNFIKKLYKPELQEMIDHLNGLFK